METEPKSNESDDSRMKKGREMMDIMDPLATDHLYELIGDINPALADFVLKHAYAEIISRPALSVEKREIATISVLAAMGNAEKELKIHFKKALHIGIPKEELVELMLHLTVYAGYPAAINGTLALKEVLKEQENMKTS